jgi:catechol 2,3-dioxygenase-like lactoylglutathione lyase family enzyme
MDAHIGYMAIVSDNPQRLADFYATYFGMHNMGSSPEGDISITDTFLNVSILKRRPGVEGASGRPGLSHFGISINDIREVEGNLEEFAPNVNIEAEPGDLHHGEYRVIGPNGLPISLSTRNFGVIGTPRTLPRIRHMAFNRPAISDDQLDFLTNVFGFREVSLSKKRREQGRASRFGGDGHINIALLALDRQFHNGEEEWEIRDRREEERLSKAGFNHFGFIVEDMDGLMASLPEELRDTAKRSMAKVDMAEFRIHDPDFNGIDISQRGYEVDFDHWENATGRPLTTAERFAS